MNIVLCAFSPHLMTHRGGAWSQGVTGPGGGCLVPGGGCLVPGGAWSGGSGPGGYLVETPPPGWLLLWAVRILLECILVFFRLDIFISKSILEYKISMPRLSKKLQSKSTSFNSRSSRRICEKRTEICVLITAGAEVFSGLQESLTRNVLYPELVSERF